MGGPKYSCLKMNTTALSSFCSHLLLVNLLETSASSVIARLYHQADRQKTKHLVTEELQHLKP